VVGGIECAGSVVGRVYRVERGVCWVSEAGCDECVDWLSVVDVRERSVLSVLSVVSVLRGWASGRVR
jgi:hypothetical protein